VRRRLLALGVLAATVVAALAAAPRLAGLAAVATLVPPADPSVSLDREVTQAFGFENPVVWVLEARDGSVWTTPMLRRLAALTEDVRRIPGVIALDVIGLASPNMRDLRITEDGLQPTYLMGEVPATPEAIAALRRRIDGDPNYAGTLVSRDGRAAMVVANFRGDADRQAVGAACIAVRDRHRDAETALWATGGPVLAVAAPAALAGVAPRAALFALLGVMALGAALGVRAAAAALVAAALAAVWIVTGAAFAGATLPWALAAVVPGALVAAAVAGGARPARAALVAAVSMLAAALVSGPPARALWAAGAAGAPLAALAGWLTGAVVEPTARPLVRARAARALAVAIALGACLGLPRVDYSLGLLGYGERYLPPAAAADLAAVRRLFPPPLSLALRARGGPGFVTAPEVLRALDAVAAATRTEPAVRGAMSIADVVKMVHRAFNDERPEFLVIPDDPALAGRYLALAYSPAFRRFLDRAFSATALWVQVESERPADLERVVARMRATLAERPVPGATVDLPAGDGALVLVMARVARRIAVSAGAALVVAALVAAGLLGWRAGVRAVGLGLLAAGVGAGVLGWAGHAVDLVSLSLLAATAVTTAALGAAASPPARLALGIAGAGAVALAAPLPAAPVIAALLLGAGLAFLVGGASTPVRPKRAAHLTANPSPKPPGLLLRAPCR
jgi:hypothetical protein